MKAGDDYKIKKTVHPFSKKNNKIKKSKIIDKFKLPMVW